MPLEINIWRMFLLLKLIICSPCSVPLLLPPPFLLSFLSPILSSSFPSLFLSTNIYLSHARYQALC